MTGSHILSVCALAITFLISLNSALAADRGVFSGKTPSMHELSYQEKKKITYEFKKLFSKDTEAKGYQKIGGNPWKAKKAKQQSGKNSKSINSWGECREYTYKKRGQCYARGNNAYKCERYYDARVSYCADQF